LAANPQVDHAVVTASEIEPATWRNIHLRMQKPHGGTLEIVLLRPLAWLAEQVDEFEQLFTADVHASALDNAVREGRDRTGWQLDSDVGHDTGWIHLVLPELGAVGPAEVLAIEPCPPLASGPGRTVTGTFAHSAADVLDLEIEGLDTPLGCTANHPFWSADRQDFVAAGSLTIGEHLRTESGTLRQVTRITPRRGPPVPVFNLEVDAEHVYYVSTAGVLVHNTYPGNAPNSVLARGTKAREVLAGNLGKHSFPVDAQAHHIFGVELFDTQLGKKLQGWGIDLNGAANGVYLPKYDYAGRVASLHRGRTAAAYTDEVVKLLGRARSGDDAIAILNKIRDDLLNGRRKINGAE
jgi:hypothetical protein